MRHTQAALEWIVGILQKLAIPFEIDGGLAAQMYGATRELADIDINVPAEHFLRIEPYVREYLTFGPGVYEDEHWKARMMSMKFAGQNIDIGALGKMQYFDDADGAWKDLPADLSSVRVMRYMDMELPFINEAKLIVYKEELGRGVDRKDVAGMKAQLAKEWE